jgi:hypothetical protein
MVFKIELANSLGNEALPRRPSDDGPIEGSAIANGRRQFVPQKARENPTGGNE